MMSPAASDKFEIERSLLSVAYTNLVSMLAVTVLAATGAAYVLARHDSDWANLWWGSIVGLSAIRFVSWRRYKQAALDAKIVAHADVARWRRTYAMGLYASCLLWAALWWAMPNAPVSLQYTLALIMAALAGGGTGIIAAYPREGRVYIAVMLGPASLALFSNAGDGPVLTALGLVFLAAMLVVHARNHEILYRAIALQLENAALVDDLKSLNAGLEIKVGERTDALKQLAYRDNLTGLPNRRGLMEWMEAHLDADGGEAAVLFLDLDHFKQINDAMGHDVGDHALRTAANRLAGCVPEDAILARWGGDEFVLAMSSRPQLRAEVERLAGEMLSLIRRPFVIEGQSLVLGLSIGSAYFPTDAASHKGAILAADLAVAEVKRTGRGALLAYSDTYAETQRRRFELGRALSAAIARGGLSLEFQPIVDVESGRIHAYEALTRWRHPELGNVTPDEFIALAEESDRIVALGDWVLKEACTQAASWRHESAVKVAVNASIKQLLEPGFALRVMQVLTQTGLPAGRLELEVTESVFDDEHAERLRAVVTSLRALGIAILIDDFGVGYSSLSRLQNFPVSALKIDKSFVQQIEGAGAVIVESAVLIARRFGLTVVAEGVETPAQLEVLRRLGVDLVQGYLLGRPSAAIDQDCVEAEAFRRAAS